ncbi:MAG TPA: ATP-binding protein [Patescibacteria group bacterium]|nr:ATP-binding protein [Patescibacteria group bacterium]
MTLEQGAVAILVVDDEPQILTSIVDLLENDFIVRTASSGRAALEILAKERFGVIISDQRMPEMSGDEFFHLAQPLSDAVRVLLTGYTDVQALARAINQGHINAYVAKPWNPIDLRVVVTNAAQQYRLAQRLEHERGMLEALMRNVPDAIFFKDTALRFERVNEAETRLLGLAGPAEAVGHTLSELRPGPHAAAIEAEELQVINTGAAIVDQEVVIQAESAEPLWLSTTRIPIRDQRGEITGLAAICRDVTRRKQAKLVLQRSNDELEAAVLQRTETLRLEVALRSAAEEEARLAREVAETSNRAKSTFLANMSHELRTPLNAIIGFSELILCELFGSIDNPIYVDYVKSINDSAHHLLQIINDILDVSRIEVGKVVLCEERVGLSDLIESAVRLVKPAAAKKDHRLSMLITQSDLNVTVDNRVMKQVLLNVLSNAVKFTAQGGSITVTASAEDGCPVIHIVDTGIGIAMEDLPTVMKPFGQVDTGLARKYDGTGLGLPLSKAFMELHGGDLEITSVPGQGTTVTLRLPAERWAPADD